MPSAKDGENDDFVSPRQYHSVGSQPYNGWYTIGRQAGIGMKNCLHRSGKTFGRGFRGRPSSCLALTVSVHTQPNPTRGPMSENEVRAEFYDDDENMMSAMNNGSE